jgi:DNA-binding MarR family transcriptional regulator
MFRARVLSSSESGESQGTASIIVKILETRATQSKALGSIGSMSNHSASCRAQDAFLEELPFQVVELSLGFQNLIRRLRAEVHLPEEMALGMGAIYFALLAEDGCRIKDLGERLHMPKGTLSGLLKGMEARGLVELHDCPEDGRARRIQLTAKARRHEAALRKRHHLARQILESGLSATEAGRLQSLLRKVLANLRAEIA